MARGIDITSDMQSGFFQPRFHGVEDDFPDLRRILWITFPLGSRFRPSARSVPDLFDGQPYRSGSRIYDAPSQ